MVKPEALPETPPVVSTEAAAPPPFPEKQSWKWKKWILICTIMAIILSGGVGYFSLSKLKTKPDTNTNQVVPTKAPPLVKPVVVEGRGVVFLQKGKIWTIDENGKQIAFSIGQNKDTVAKFTFSPDGKEAYWTTDKGELFKTNEQKASQPLVSIASDMKIATQEASLDPKIKKPLTYYMGAIEDFWLSPDGNIIAYTSLESYAGCCGRPPDIPVVELKTMQSAGTNKIVIPKPSGQYGQFLGFVSFFPDSKNVLFYYSSPDQPTTGSPFFQAEIDGRSYQQFAPIFSQQSQFPQFTVANAQPHFSPDNKKMAYIEDGVNGEGKVWMANIDGSGKKLIIDQGFQMGDIKWSQDGTRLLADGTSQLFVFDQTGEILYKTERPQTDDIIKGTFSSDNMYLAGVYSNIKTGGALFLVNLATNKKKELKLTLPNYEVDISPQLYADSKLYYLVNSVRAPEQETDKSLPQLWVFNTTDWTANKLSDNVSQVSQIPSTFKFTSQ